MHPIQHPSPARPNASHGSGLLTAEQAATLHPAPPVTDSKIRRLRLLAQNPNPKIRESVASSHHTPNDVFTDLAHDPDPGVRGCVARNENTPCDVLRELAHDESEQVRGWVAVNYYVPNDSMTGLAHDPSPTVRSLVTWKMSLAATQEPSRV